MALTACQPRPAVAPRSHDTLHQAFEAAFGKPAPYETIDDSDDHVVYAPQALIDLSPRLVALVSEKTIPDGCRKCGGSLTIDYLKRTTTGFQRAGHWADIGGQGVYGRALPWTQRMDIEDNPTLVTRREQREGECSSVKSELISLRPTGAVKSAEVILATTYAASAAQHLPASGVTGAIKPLVKGKSFVVTLTGSERARQVFQREGEVFVTRDFGATGC